VTTAQNLLRAAARNLPSVSSFRLCEWTRVFWKRDRKAPDRPREVPVAGLLAVSAGRPRKPKGDEKGSLFLSVKEAVLILLERLGVVGARAEDAGEATLDEALPAPAWLHPGRRAAFRAADGQVLAIAGEVLPATARGWGLDAVVAIAEVRLDRV